MATLNENWQQLTSAGLYGNITICIDGKLVSQSTQNNTSTIQLRFRNSGDWWRTTNGTCGFTGTFTDSGGCATYPDKINDGDAFFTITKTISHDANGDLSILVGGYINAYISGANRSATISQVTASLPHINRYAIISGSNNFNDEQNPYFTFSNPAGYRINARLEFAGQSIRRDNISNTGSYTFVLTDAERTQLRQYCTGKTMSVNYVLATCYTGTTEAHTESQTKTMSIVNGNPTFSVTYEDTNATTLAITNNNQQIIQSNSTLQFNISNATALKEATLNKVKVNINGIVQEQSISTSTLTFNYGTINVSSNINANVILVDSRGFETTIPVSLIVLSWSLPNAIITLQRKSNYYTQTDITVDANYSSLDSKNTILIKYRYKKTTSSTWSAYTTISDNIQDTFNADNLYEWDVQVLVQDLLGSTTYNLTLGIGQPIMFVDRRNRNVGIDCFPQSTNALEVKGNTNIKGILKLNDYSIFDYIYPIGSIYLSINNTNPSSLFGGTWVAFGTGKTLVGVDTSQTEFNSVEKTGGEKTHTLTVDEIPSHTHKDGTDTSAGINASSGNSSAVVYWNANIGRDTSATGGGLAHNNLQPYITCYMWKRTA